MKRRPINLNFLTMYFPITAWVSILHRLSGFFLFLMIPLFLWILQESLTSEERFLHLKSILTEPLVKGVLWVVLVALLYHCIAGIRHLLMDVHVGESKTGGKRGAWMVIFLSIVLFLVAGYWIWLR